MDGANAGGDLTDRSDWRGAPILFVINKFANVLVSLKRGSRTGNVPWKDNTLEWFVPFPPPENNFDVVPRVRSVEPVKDIRREVGAAPGTVATVTEPVTPGI